jgi:hypothetical protein
MLRLRFKFACALGALACGVLLGRPSAAALITFDSIVPSEIIYSGLEHEGAVFTSDHFHLYGRMRPQPDVADNGSTWLGFESGRGEAVTMSLLDHSLFSLLSLDLSEFYGISVNDRPDAQVVTLVGTTGGGETVAHQLFLDSSRADGIGGVTDFEPFSLPDTFTDLSSVTLFGTRLDGRDGGLAVDNILYVSVPEPASVSLLGLGIVGLIWSRRRHRSDRHR